MKQTRIFFLSSVGQFVLLQCFYKQQDIFPIGAVGSFGLDADSNNNDLLSLLPD